MTVMYKATMVWNGFPGAPGYTNLYAITTDPLLAGAADFLAGIATWRTTVRNLLASTTTLSILGTVETINDEDGTLEDVLTVASPPADVAGAQSGGTTGVTGVVVNWLTAGAVFGRRRQGRSFLVPIAVASIDPDGTVSAANLTAQRAAAATYVAGGGGDYVPCVWVRPKYTTADPPVLVHAGQAVPITGSRIPDLAAVLRSRRD
jgi:hypothetical protein